MRMRVDFPRGALGGHGSGVIERFAEEAVAVLLETGPGQGEKCLLGAARAILPQWRAELTDEERGVLGMEPGDACEAYCRVRIPQDDPGAAGFDFSRFIVVCPRTGLALEKEGEGQPLVPFRSAAGR